MQGDIAYVDCTALCVCALFWNQDSAAQADAVHSEWPEDRSAPIGDSKRQIASLEKIQAQLHWNPTVVILVDMSWDPVVKLEVSVMSRDPTICKNASDVQTSWYHKTFHLWQESWDMWVYSRNNVLTTLWNLVVKTKLAEINKWLRWPKRWCWSVCCVQVQINIVCRVVNENIQH